MNEGCGGKIKCIISSSDVHAQKYRQAVVCILTYKTKGFHVDLSLSTTHASILLVMLGSSHELKRRGTNCVEGETLRIDGTACANKIARMTLPFCTR